MSLHGLGRVQNLHWGKGQKAPSGIELASLLGPVHEPAARPFNYQAIPQLADGYLISHAREDCGLNLLEMSFGPPRIEILG